MGNPDLYALRYFAPTAEDVGDDLLRIRIPPHTDPGVCASSTQRTQRVFTQSCERRLRQTVVPR